MQFRDLYKYVLGLGSERPIGFELLRHNVLQGVSWLEEVKVWRLVHNPPSRQSRYTLFDDRSGPYVDEHLVADISYCAALEDDPPELLFALCKELMHVFDERNTWIDTEEKFRQFLRDLQNTPLDSQNGALNAERRAKWMALLVILPKPNRDLIANEIKNGRALRSEVAERLGLPEWLIENAIDDYYDSALTLLTK